MTFEDTALRVLAGGLHPDHKALSEFRRVHLTEFKDLFYQALELCKKAGWLKLGHVALDGTQIEANAHKAMSYERMKSSEERLKQESQVLLDGAEAVDTSEDKQYGAGGLADWKLAGELERREARLAKIQQARKELEAEAAAARARVLSERAALAAEKAAETPAGERGVAVGSPSSAVDSTAVETTEGRPTATGSHAPVGADKAASEKEAERRPRHAEKLRLQTEEAGEQARKAAVEAGMAAPDVAVREPEVPPGYWSEENGAWCKANGIDAYIAVGRAKHENASGRYLRLESEVVPPTVPEKRPPKEQMAAKLKTADWRAVFSHRKVIVEPAFGQLKGPATGAIPTPRTGESPRGKGSVLPDAQYFEAVSRSISDLEGPGASLAGQKSTDIPCCRNPGLQNLIWTGTGEP